MKMRLDIMTDIETLGTDSDSTIIQISAIAFNIKTGEHYSQFNQIADISKNESPLKVDGDTVQWWLKTNKELFADLLNSGTYSSEQVLRNLHGWLLTLNVNNDRELYLWGNGILFDNKMIKHQLESLGLNYPIFYRNDRDLRTLVELTSIKLGISEKELQNKCSDDKLVTHNAFDDVVYQIKLAVHCFKELT
jgi:hypothetical protein